MEAGTGAAAARRAVTLRVTNRRGQWRIAGYEMAGSPEGSQDPATSGDAAAAVILRYYTAIAAGDYRTAYAQWGDGGARSGQTFDDFVTGYAETASVTALVGEPSAIEGAAGSRYVTVPVEIRAFTTDDTAQRFAGRYTLRRSVVDGATAAPRRWHIHSAEIRRVGGAHR